MNSFAEKHIFEVLKMELKMEAEGVWAASTTPAQHGQPCRAQKLNTTSRMPRASHCIKVIFMPSSFGDKVVRNHRQIL